MSRLLIVYFRKHVYISHIKSLLLTEKSSRNGFWQAVVEYYIVLPLDYMCLTKIMSHRINK